MSLFEYDIGDRIRGKRGEYRVKGRLGAGGMGACYLAEDTDSPRPVVIKTLQANLAQKGGAREAFELEARGLMALHACPNIVQVFQLDQTKEGAPFYLMEHLSGLSLRQVLKRKKLPVDIAIGIGAGLASALEFAHNKQVVHCDVKPENIFIVQRDDGPMVKLLDFGVMKAKLVSGGYGGAAGTAAYMAPEQLRKEDVDQRADLFATGYVLYEMFSGKHPFPVRDEAGAMVRIDKLPVPLAEIARDIPWQVVNVLDDLIKGLCAPNRDRRAKDASEILVKLHEAKRALGRLGKKDVHAASTNPMAPPEELIAQMTGVVDDEALAGKTDPMLDLSSEPELEAAVAMSADDSAPSAALDLSTRERDMVQNFDKYVKVVPGKGVVVRNKPKEPEESFYERNMVAIGVACATVAGLVFVAVYYLFSRGKL